MGTVPPDETSPSPFEKPPSATAPAKSDGVPGLHPETETAAAIGVRQHLLKDWWGLRSWLEARGIRPGIVYTVDLLGNVSGGDPRYEAFAPLGDLDVSLEFDTQKLGLWEGGTLFVHFQSIAGRSNEINRRIHDPLNSVSDLNAIKTTQVSELFYLQTLVPHRLYLKIGKQDANTDFAASAMSGAFINGGISPPAIVPVPSYPDPSLGLALLGTVGNNIELGAGVFGSQYEGQSLTDSGLFDGELFAVGEIGIPVDLGELQGKYNLGAWYRSEPPSWNYSGPPVEDDYGFYLLIDQQLFRENREAEDAQGLAGFFQASWAPSDRNDFDLWVGGGIVYTGLLPGRDRDRSGVAVVFARASPRIEQAGFTREIVIEYFYEWIVTDWLILKPDFQYFSDPGGTPNDSIVLGLRTVVIF